MSKDIQDIVAFANSLSNNDLANLITMLGDRLDVYVGQLGRHQISSPVQDACMNGSVVQINLELAGLDDISEDAFVKNGLESWLHKRKAQSDDEDLEDFTGWDRMILERFDKPEKGGV